MADQQQQPPVIPEKTLPTVYRYITTHSSEGVSTFETGIPEAVDFERNPMGGDMFLAWSATAFPAALARDVDLDGYRAGLEPTNKPASFSTAPGGFQASYIDFHPGCAPFWHRTRTIDFGVVIEGEVLLELEGGEKRVLKKGDTVVQRGTNHAWSNPSQTEFARVFYIALDAQAPVVNGGKLAESFGVVSHK
ncbi:uncharacterized protein PG998_004702 [Apiospora kogelbergensis]|uniref:uncharacterized protein n=1 Tax=Apiospora kogelbergensis TaxID=1337665 RepID=UPI00313022D4